MVILVCWRLTSSWDVTPVSTLLALTSRGERPPPVPVRGHSQDWDLYMDADSTVPGVGNTGGCFTRLRLRPGQLCTAPWS